MTELERKLLKKAIGHLMADDGDMAGWNWDSGMDILCTLNEHQGSQRGWKLRRLLAEQPQGKPVYFADEG